MRSIGFIIAGAVVASCGSGAEQLCGDWKTVPLPDVTSVVSCRPNELVVKSTAPTDRIVDAYRTLGYEPFVDLQAPAKGMQFRNLERDKADGRSVGILVSRTPDGYALKRDFGGETAVLFPYAPYEKQGAYDKVKTAVIARHAALSKLLDTPAAASAPPICAPTVQLAPKLRVLGLDIVNKGYPNEGYNLGMADDPYAEKTTRTLLQLLTESPIAAVSKTRRRIDPNVAKGLSGEIETEVAIVDAAAGTVLCHTTVTTHNSAKVEYTITTEATGAQSDSRNINISLDLAKNQAKDVSDALMKLLGRTAT